MFLVDVLNFLDFKFFVFNFMDFFFRFLLKVTEVTIEHQKCPKMSKNCIRHTSSSSIRSVVIEHSFYSLTFNKKYKLKIFV